MERNTSSQRLDRVTDSSKADSLFHFTAYYFRYSEISGMFFTSLHGVGNDETTTGNGVGNDENNVVQRSKSKAKSTPYRHKG